MPNETIRVDFAAGSRGARLPGRRQQAAGRQTVLREVNENIARLTASATEVGYCLFVCECSSPSCAEALEITAAEYEAVRSDGGCFLVAPGHQRDGVDRVVAGNARFLVVETA